MNSSSMQPNSNSPPSVDTTPPSPSLDVSLSSRGADVAASMIKSEQAASLQQNYSQKSDSPSISPRIIEESPNGISSVAEDEDSTTSDNDYNEKEPKEKEEKRGGRRKINIEFIENKSRRHVTFSKRKAGLIKKAYELSTLTGTQVLLLVASETGNVYTFATPKLQPLITKPEGKTLIQACLNPPESDLPTNHVGPSHQVASHHAPSQMNNTPTHSTHIAASNGSSSTVVTSPSAASSSATAPQMPHRIISNDFAPDSAALKERLATREREAYPTRAATHPATHAAAHPAHGHSTSATITASTSGNTATIVAPSSTVPSYPHPYSYTMPPPYLQSPYLQQRSFYSNHFTQQQPQQSATPPPHPHVHYTAHYPYLLNQTAPYPSTTLLNRTPSSKE